MYLLGGLRNIAFPSFFNRKTVGGRIHFAGYALQHISTACGRIFGLRPRFEFQILTAYAVSRLAGLIAHASHYSETGRTEKPRQR